MDIPLRTGVTENGGSQRTNVIDCIVAVFLGEFFNQIGSLKCLVSPKGLCAVEMVPQVRIPVALIALGR